MRKIYIYTALALPIFSGYILLYTNHPQMVALSNNNHLLSWWIWELSTLIWAVFHVVALRWWQGQCSSPQRLLHPFVWSLVWEDTSRCGHKLSNDIELILSWFSWISDFILIFPSILFVYNLLIFYWDIGLHNWFSVFFTSNICI